MDQKIEVKDAVRECNETAAQINETPITDKLRKKAGKAFLKKEPSLEGLLEELGRLEIIRGQLYSVFTDSKKILDTFTNKAGAVNIVVTATVKEYKAYSAQFVTVVKAINEIMAKQPPRKKEKADGLMAVLNRGKK